MAHIYDSDMYNIDPATKRKKQTRVRRQLVNKTLHEESEENFMIEVQQKVTKKYQNYLHTIQKIGEFDWTDIENTNNPKVIYPIQFLQASTLQFMIAATYFNCDHDYLEHNLQEVQKLLKKTEQTNGTSCQDDCKKQKNKKGYDVNDDIFILEMRQLRIQDLDYIILNQELELEKIQRENEKAIQNFLSIDIPNLKPPIKTDQSNNLLRDISGLTEFEKQYIEKIELKIQTDGQNVITQETGKKTQGGGIHLQPILDDALCQVCNDGDYTDDNLIVFCSKCNISVHQKCYLIEVIPNEDWICDVCQTFGPNGQYLRCALCPKLGGAMKATSIDASCFENLNQTYFESQGETMMKNDLVSKLFQQIDDDQELYYDFSKLPNRDIRDLENNKDIKEPQPQKVWIHLSCFYWSPECFLDEKQDILRGVDNINQKRFIINCSLCNIKKAGMCIQCARGNCQTGFHVECARRSGIFLTQTIVNTKPDYQIFCQKHVPLKVKRILESKQRLYEREIIDFFRAYEKCKSVHKKSKQRVKKTKSLKEAQQQELQDHQENEFDLIDFATKLKEFIDQLLDQKMIVNLKLEQGKYVFESISEPQLKQQKQYYLTKLPEVYQSKVDQNGLIITQFYKSAIAATDELWKFFKYRDYEKDIIYKMYEKLRRKASKFMQDLNPQKKQAKLIDIIMLKKFKKSKKADQKKEIIIEQVGDEYYQRDDNLYCVCRGKFKDGDPMICCESCEEWFHFDCLEIIISNEELSKINFYCFLCIDDLPKERQIEIYNGYTDVFKDASFKLQRELADKCSLNESRKLRMNQLKQDALIEEKNKLIQENQEQESKQEQIQLEEQNNNQNCTSLEFPNNYITKELSKEIILTENNYLQIEIHNEGTEKNKKNDEHVKTPSKTESVEDPDNKLEVPDTQEKLNSTLKLKSIHDYIPKK
ncbi:unnamed protein product [Paramecium pentaurelia]|uniref:Uncharacterized protein n=1 Tax=Paramecium pentaurelia TaxID=43138 RepID=A0A8S1SIS6_9CILI|nr:unnamed protein product [Paramecium pentaurelia]